MKNKKLIATIICLAAALGIIIVLIAPAWRSVRESRSEIKEKKGELSAIENLIVKTGRIKKEQRELEKETAKVSLALPEKKDIPGLLVQFETLASMNGLILESIDFEGGDEAVEKSAAGVKWTVPQNEKKSEGQFKTMEVNLTLSGAYGSFKNFLGALENNIRSINVSSINFNSGQLSLKESTADFFEFRLKVKVYYQ
ncbi:MAG: hypothetical protein A3H00_00885 [Candidatus Portnoybacteria bacterium RBG_13_40_8]|nr:MAG: hypothetical protein A3H00_00885 [Candidatus Portnoybacteria bacterium RBG_13_40_8]